jgi:glycosyltransferase involved in cell wall biosynthesis
MNLTVAVDASAYFSAPLKGEGKTLARLYREVHRLRPDWRIVFLGPRAPVSSTSIDGIELHAFGGVSERLGLWEDWSFPARAHKLGAHLLHGASSAGPRYARVPSVITVHDLIPLTFGDGWSNSAIRRFRRHLGRGLRGARAVIAVSQHTKRDVLEFFAIDPDRVWVIPWGADDPDPAFASTDTRAMLRRLNLQEPFVLAFGGSARRKNTRFVIDVFAAFSASNADVNLVLVGGGRGSARESLESAIAAHCLEARVKILNDLSDADLDSLYRHATCLLYLSLYEGFGLPVVEAMARGVAVIASNRTSIPEVAGDAAVLTDPTDERQVVAALERVCGNLALRQELARRGIERAARFQWRQTAERTIAVFEAALDH